MFPEGSIVFVFFILQAIAPETTTPKFEDFPVAKIFKGTPALPVLRTPGERMFRTMIREGAKKGPNFAGHFTIAQWGCGSDCGSLAIIDAENGAVTIPFGAIAFPPPMDFVGGGDEDRVSFRLDSRLLVIYGCPGEKDCASYYYEWTRSTLKLIRKTPAVERRN